MAFAGESATPIGPGPEVPMGVDKRAGLYLITGGAGFIGSHLADALLRAGHRVRVLDNFSTGRLENLDPACEVVRGDVADTTALRQAMQGVTGCFHLAAVASVARCNEHWLESHQTNMLGTVAVFETARELGRIPVVYASSAAVYGDAGEQIASEDIAPAPRTAYGVDKFGAEMHGRVAFSLHRIPTLGLRFFNVYGPRQDPGSPYSGVISIFTQRIRDALPIGIHGDGLQTRDFVFVSDVVEHMLKGMDHLHASPCALVLNVCTGQSTSVLSLARMLGSLQGQRVELMHSQARPGDIRHSVGDPSRAMAVLGVRAHVTLQDGLMRALAQGEDSTTSLVQFVPRRKA